MERGQIFEAPDAKDFVEKEVEAAEQDLISAQESRDDEDFKWATIQAY